MRSPVSNTKRTTLSAGVVWRLPSHFGGSRCASCVCDNVTCRLTRRRHLFTKRQLGDCVWRRWRACSDMWVWLALRRGPKRRRAAAQKQSSVTNVSKLHTKREDSEVAPDLHAPAWRRSANGKAASFLCSLISSHRVFFKCLLGGCTGWFDCHSVVLIVAPAAWRFTVAF